MPFVPILRVAREHLHCHLANKYEEHARNDVVSRQFMRMVATPYQGECKDKNHDTDPDHVDS